jgi:hypothetical protein
MLSIRENNFNQPIYVAKECQIKTTLGIAISIIFALGGLFLLLASYQILPYGANCISQLGASGLALGWGLSGLGVASLIYHIRKSCSRHPTSRFVTSPRELIDQPVAMAPQTNEIQKNCEEPNNISEDENCEWAYCSFPFNCDLEGGSAAYLTPDENKLSDLFSRCTNPNVRFLPGSLYAGKRVSLPIQEIKDAFAEGKNMVFALLGTGIHCFAIGCCADGSDGSFKIIDPMFDNSIDCAEVANTLNQAKIRNPQGKLIHFSGEYINTHIQRGGNDCVRFATLYCYHMAARQDLEAYQEVNRTFLEGRLRRFEDYEKISGARKIRSLAGEKYTYDSFMLSWKYRMIGLRVDSWQELSLQEIFAKKPISDSIALLSKDKKLPEFLGTGLDNLFIRTPTRETTIYPDNLHDLLEQVHVDMNIPINQSLRLEENEFLLHYRGGSSFELFRLREDQKLCNKLRYAPHYHG